MHGGASRSGTGSSPLTRGKRYRWNASVGALGLIPAHAGKTGVGVPGYRLVGAHPRSRGENERVLVVIHVERGSSPLTRGKQTRPAALRAGPGLIPAHAGKTEFAGALIDGSGAHPRSRGENFSLTAALGNVVGSSPLTRGKHSDGRDHERVCGLIPAHAGKTPAYVGVLCARWAHPRSRGENIDGDNGTGHDGGSSPLTRGKQGANVR